MVSGLLVKLLGNLLINISFNVDILTQIGYILTSYLRYKLVVYINQINTDIGQFKYIRPIQLCNNKGLALSIILWEELTRIMKRTDDDTVKDDSYEMIFDDNKRMIAFMSKCEWML